MVISCYIPHNLHSQIIFRGKYRRLSLRFATRRSWGQFDRNSQFWHRRSFWFWRSLLRSRWRFQHRLLRSNHWSRLRNTENIHLKVQAPAQHWEYPLRKVQAPAQHWEYPLLKVQAPAQHWEYPLRKVQAPAQHWEYPLLKVQAPAQHWEYPLLNPCRPLPWLHLSDPEAQPPPPNSDPHPHQQQSALGDQADSQPSHHLGHHCHCHVRHRHLRHPLVVDAFPFGLAFRLPFRLRLGLCFGKLSHFSRFCFFLFSPAGQPSIQIMTTNGNRSRKKWCPQQIPKINRPAFASSVFWFSHACHFCCFLNLADWSPVVLLFEIPVLHSLIKIQIVEEAVKKDRSIVLRSLSLLCFFFIRLKHSCNILLVTLGLCKPL